MTVITGTWIVDPWYRDPAPDSPRSELLAIPDTADWHTFGMEWKEHVAWISPILAAAVAFIVLCYGDQLIRHERVRRTTMLLFVLAFVFAAVAGAFGAFITEVRAEGPDARGRPSLPPCTGSRNAEATFNRRVGA